MRIFMEEEPFLVDEVGLSKSFGVNCRLLFLELENSLLLILPLTFQGKVLNNFALDMALNACFYS